MRIPKQTQFDYSALLSSWGSCPRFFTRFKLGREFFLANKWNLLFQSCQWHQFNECDENLKAQYWSGRNRDLRRSRNHHPPWDLQREPLRGSHNYPIAVTGRVMDDLELSPRIGMETIMNGNSGTFGILECCCSIRTSIPWRLCLWRHRRHYVGFPTMWTTVARTALIQLLGLFEVDIVSRSPFCTN